MRYLRCIAFVVLLLFLLYSVSAMAASMPSRTPAVGQAPNPVKQQLKLLTPASGDRLEADAQYKITWTSYGLAKQIVELVLLKDGQEKGVIARLDVGAGTYDWKVGRVPPYTELPTGSGYTIRIRLLSGTLSDQRDFVLAAPPGTGKLTAQQNIKVTDIADKLSEKFVKITGPTAGTTANRYGELDITYEFSPNLKNKHMKLLLYKDGTKPGLQSYTIIDKWKIYTGHFHINLPGPEAINLGAYRIRLQCLEYPDVFADSPVIQIVPKERYVTRVIAAKTSSHEKARFAHKDKVIVKYDTNSYQQPGPSEARVGYRYIKNDDRYVWYLYRTHIAFDLSGLAGKVKWAKLSYVKNDGTPDGPRPIFALTMPWNGSASDLFSYTGKQVDAMNGDEMRALVQGWLDEPQMNFGLVMRGPKEWQEENKNQGHIMWLTNVQLELGITILE